MVATAKHVIEAMEFLPAPSSRMTKTDAKLASEALQRIHEKHSKLTGRLVLEAASDPRSPLHKFFEWDDTKAAERHRLAQAGALIRTIKISVSIVGKQEPRSMPAYVSVVGDQGRSYQPTMRAMRSPNLRDQIVQQALEDLAAWQARYKNLSEFAEVMSAIHIVRKRVAGKPARRSPQKARKVA
jgi:hypothetical protein